MRFFYLSLVLCVLFSPATSWGFNDLFTHPRLTERAFPHSSLNTHLKNDFGLQLGVWERVGEKRLEEWLKYGAEMEDQPACRASNHFHNPSLLWTEAGLTDTHWIALARCTFDNYQHDARISNLTWGTGYLSNNIGYRDGEILNKNEWDWDSSREYLYTYLTGKDSDGNLVAEDDSSRQQYLAKSIQSLGQVLHLLQDMAVPAHVRNDFSQGHMFFKPFLPTDDLKTWKCNPFERYVKDNNSRVWFNDIEKGAISTPSLTDFWDTDDSTGINPLIASGRLGLSEYTFINFLSEYRMFTNDFPYPRKEHCAFFLDIPHDDPTAPLRKYLASINGHPGEQIEHLALVSNLDYYVKRYFPNLDGMNPLPLKLDDKCYEEYASKLIPRAIGYSADLIDYFFRGTLQVTALPIPYNNTIRYIDLRVKNITQTQEELTNGFFTLVVRYTPVGANPDGSEDSFKTYVLSSGSLSYDQETRLIFSLIEPVPLETIDSLKCMLVFKGTLGSEENAIIAKPFSTGKIKFLESWDTALPGNFPWYHSTDAQNFNNGSTLNETQYGILNKDNIRFINEDQGRINQSFIYFRDFNSPHQEVDTDSPDGILITPDTYLIFKVDDLSINQDPPAPEGYSTAYQYMDFEFNTVMNGQSMPGFLALQISQEGQAVARPYINDVTLGFPLGQIIMTNIYNAFQSRGLTIPEPFYLQVIDLHQKLEGIEELSTIQHRQRMEVDYISIVEGYKEQN